MDKLLKGKELADKIKSELNSQITAPLTIAVIQIGENKPAKLYTNNIRKLSTRLKVVDYTLPETAVDNDIIKIINSLNESSLIKGILVHMPLPAHLNKVKILSQISPAKDIDCLSPYSLGLLSLQKDGFLPCTPYGILELLKGYNIPLAGKECVIVGRSTTVGKPLAQMLLMENATVTVCHSQTKNLSDVAKRGDILIVAVGKPNFATAPMIKEDAVVVDVGIHMINSKPVGDVNFEDVKNTVRYITPVPGGVGPMTTAMLLKNIIKASREISNNSP